MSIAATIRRPRTSITRAQARRVALAAQGFGRPRPDRAPGMRDLQGMITRLGQFQIDSINVVTRAHFMPLFSRLGPYDVGLLERAAHRAPRRLFEYWGHAASLIDVQLQPPLRFRMDAGAATSGAAWSGSPATTRIWSRRFVTRSRPGDRSAPASSRSRRCATGATGAGTGRGSRPCWSGCSSWARSPRRTGTPSSSGSTTCRSGCCPDPCWINRPPTRPNPSANWSGAPRPALGVASEFCLRDYFRTRPEATRAAIADLVEAGELMPVTIEGWEAKPTYLWHEARLPRADRRRGRCSVRSTR